ncbi:MAG: ribbon-helix-helix domain-containing protein [archaeon]
MTTQINIRMPDNLLDTAKDYAESMGFSNVQDFIRETVREKLFDEPKISKEEFALVNKLVNASEEKKLYGTEKELLKKLG